MPVVDHAACFLFLACGDGAAFQPTKATPVLCACDVPVHCLCACSWRLLQPLVRGVQDWRAAALLALCFGCTSVLLSVVPAVLSGLGIVLGSVLDALGQEEGYVAARPCCQSPQGVGGRDLPRSPARRHVATAAMLL
jgi:hypothetical protein